MHNLFDKLKPGTILEMKSDKRYLKADGSERFFKVEEDDTLEVIELIPTYRRSLDDSFRIGPTRFTMPQMYGVGSMIMRHLKSGVLLITNHVEHNLVHHFSILEQEVSDSKFDYIDKFVFTPNMLEWLIVKILVDRNYSVYVHPIKQLASSYSSIQEGYEEVIPVRRMNNYLFKIAMIHTHLNREPVDFKYELHLKHEFRPSTILTIPTKEVLTNWFICNRHGAPLSFNSTKIISEINMETHESYSKIMNAIYKWVIRNEQELGMNHENFVDVIYKNYGNGCYGDSSEYLYKSKLWIGKQKARKQKVNVNFMSEQERRGDERILQNWTHEQDIATIRLAIDHALDTNDKEKFNALTEYLNSIERDESNEEEDTYKTF